MRESLVGLQPYGTAYTSGTGAPPYGGSGASGAVAPRFYPPYRAEGTGVPDGSSAGAGTFLDSELLSTRTTRAADGRIPRSEETFDFDLELEAQELKNRSNAIARERVRKAAEKATHTEATPDSESTKTQRKGFFARAKSLALKALGKGGDAAPTPR